MQPHKLILPFTFSNSFDIFFHRIGIEVFKSNRLEGLIGARPIRFRDDPSEFSFVPGWRHREANNPAVRRAKGKFAS